MKKSFHYVEKAISSTSVLAIISTGLRIGGGLIALPIALRTIPQAEQGLYYTFLGVSGIIGLFDLGFASAVSRNASYAMAGAERFSTHGVPKFSGNPEPNRELLAALVSAVKRWYFLIGTMAAFCLLSFGSWFIFKQILESNLEKILLGAWILFAGSSIFSFASGFWQNLLIGSGAVRDATKINLIAQILGLIVLISSLLFGLGIWSYGASILTAALTSRLLTKKAFIRTSGIHARQKSSISFRSVFTDLWPMAWRHGAVSMGAFFIQRGNTLICSSKLGLQETGSYGLSIALLMIVLQTATVPLFIAFPQISNLRVHRDGDAIWKIFTLRLYSGVFVAILGIITIALYGNQILDLMGSQSNLLPTSTLLLLGFVLLLEQHHVQYGMLVLTENQNPFIIPSLVSGAAIFIISWFAAEKWGVVGLIVTQGIVQLCWNNWWTVKRGMDGLSEIRSGVRASQ